jgi:glucokinase
MKKAYSIGVDLGGTNLRVAAYDGGRGFLDTIVLPTRLHAGRDQVVQDMCGAIRAMMSRDFGDRVLKGIAVGTPGPLQLPAGILRNLPNFPGWDGFDLRSAITKGIGCEILLENDANFAAFAEQRLGAGKSFGVADLCVITLGTGVGNGLVLGGKVWDGGNGMAGEAGHMVVKDDEQLQCGCGGRGCLEQYASATAVVRMAREHLGEGAPATAHEVALLAKSGDQTARAVFEAVGGSLAIAFTGLISTLNLPLYLLGGGVCEAWDLFSPRMFLELERRSYIYRLTRPDVLEPAGLTAGKTYILKAELGPSAGLLGACVAGLEASTARISSRKELLGHQ